MRIVLCFTLLGLMAAPLQAGSLMDSVKEGAGKVGNIAKKGVDAVEDAVVSTTDLVTDEDTPEATRDKLDAMADDVLIRLMVENADAQEAYARSYGYAAFDMRRLSVFPLSAGYGRGVAVPPDGARTYMQMGTGGMGAAFGIGGFESQFVIMFETAEDFNRFVTDGYEAAADAGLMSGDDKTGADIQFIDGRSFFVLSRTGWRVNANASGTKYWKDADLN